MFYNCENLFDTVNDSLTNDDEFTPSGTYHWTYSRYQTKLHDVAKVIVAAGNLDPPAIIGLCEIENKKVLNNLIHKTILLKYEYKFIHKDSPDPRGIDVACLYNPSVFVPLDTQAINITLSTSNAKTTRDILYIRGILFNTDTLHLFINHWPSKVGGESKTDPVRIEVAEKLKLVLERIQKSNPAAKIIVMGDFNDCPNNNSLQVLTQDSIHNGLINLTPKALVNFPGTIKNNDQWFAFDQFLISKELLNKSGKWYAVDQSMAIFNMPFLLEEDKSGIGFKPFRTYLGRKYHGGFSDHLPIILDLYKDVLLK